jgi:hypothetical protein
MGQNCDLFFPLPEQKVANRSEIKLALDIFRNKLSNLPFGNQEKAAKEIFDILYKSNKIQLKGDDRLALLKEIEQPASQILSGLKNKINDVAAPIGRSEEKTAKILVAIHYELALAYRCLLMVDDPAKGLLRGGDKTTSANSVRHTIFHLGEVLRTKYSVFSNPRGTIWRYIYALFICANNDGIDSIKLPASIWCKFDTVEEVFKSILLMSLSSPLTMRGKEFNALYELAPELTPYISIGKVSCGEKYSDLMTFNLSGTESPKKQFATGCDSCGNAANCFTVDTSTLLKHFDEQQGKMKSSEQHTPLQRLLSKESQYQKLKHNLSGSVKVDHEQRVEGGGVVELIAGFGDICTFLNKGTEEKQVVSDGKTATDDWTTTGGESITVEETVDWTATGIIKAGLRKTTCNVINHSSGGYCLYKDASDRFHLRVGELALVKESGNSKWQLVVIIWVSGNRKRMDFGVKILSGTVSKGNISLLNGKDVVKTIDSLFLKIDNGDDDSSIRVITAAQDLGKDDRLQVVYEGNNYQVAVIDINSKTYGYVEYICDWTGFEEEEVVTQRAGTPAKNLEQAAITETDFESIWDKI